MDVKYTVDEVLDSVKEAFDDAHETTSEFHKKYISKLTPDKGKYGDAVKFIAEMVPGVSEYNAIVEGDWTAFAIPAGIDITAIAAGAVSAGIGYAAVKKGGTAAKAGMKIAVKEISEAGAKKVVKETAEAGAKKVVKETAEAGAKKVVKETAEAGAKKVVKETVEVGAEKVAKETAEAGAKKVVKETAEEGTKKVAKESTKDGVEKATKESVDKVASKSVKEVGEKLDKKLIPDYLKEVEDITNREIKPQQMEKLQKAIESQEFVKLDPEKNKLHRKLFDNARNKLIDEWEKNTGEIWPTYVEDIYSDTGEILRRAGKCYDAHHLIESSYGGPNAWWNIHPAAYPREHQAGIHAADKLANLIF